MGDYLSLLCKNLLKLYGCFSNFEYIFIDYSSKDAELSLIHFEKIQDCHISCGYIVLLATEAKFIQNTWCFQFFV